MPRTRNPHPKGISYLQAEVIRKRWAAGEATQTAMALEHGISQAAVSAIIRGKTHQMPRTAMTREEELEARRQQRFMKVYGITYEEWQAKLEAANHRCEGCGARAEDLPPHHTSGRSGLSCDHDHRTGDVRGPLCPKCNTVLGFVDDSIERLEGLVAYLKKYGTA